MFVRVLGVRRLLQVLPFGVSEVSRFNLNVRGFLQV